MVEAATNAQIKEIFERNERTVRSDRRKKTVGKAELWVTELDALLERIRTAEADKARLSEANRELHRRAQAAEGKLQRAEHAAREQIDILTSLATKLGHWPVGLSRAKTAMEQWIDARAALSGSGSGWPVPDGWKLVPVEPTEAMVLAGYNALMEWDARTGEDYGIGEVWRAMIDASPAAPQQGGE